MVSDLKNYWDEVYASRETREFSWCQDVPQTSLDMIHASGLPKSAAIIDIGGGDSNLVDHLIKEGYENVTVLDISERSINKAKQRLGKNAEKVTWLVSDVKDFVPGQTYDLWHDRATFHFLVTQELVNQYISLSEKFTSSFLLLGTFSEKGPEKCSGLPVKRYSQENLSAAFKNSFQIIRCIKEDHITPSGKPQNFLFCIFRKK